MEKKNKCEEAGFKHAWEEIKDDRVFLTMPPQYPPKRITCLNCGMTKRLITKQQELQEWVVE